MVAAIISVQNLVKDFRLGEVPVRVLKGISFEHTNVRQLHPG